MNEIKIATKNDINKLLPALLELRTNRTKVELETMLNNQFDNINKNFFIVYIGDNNQAFSVSCFRIMDMLHSGKTLYIDDFVTYSKYRKNGYAKKLLQWIKEFAIKENCNTLSLDSGFHRTDAYKLYLNFGFEVSSLHFAINIKK